MLREPQDLRRLLLRHCLVGSLVWLCTVLPNVAYATGCHYGSSQQQLSEAEKRQLVVTVLGTISTRGEVSVVYEGGQLKYYPSSEALKPCRGPQCRRNPASTLSVRVDMARQNSNQIALNTSSYTLVPTTSGRSLNSPTPNTCVGVNCGIFRPPRFC